MISPQAVNVFVTLVQVFFQRRTKRGLFLSANRTALCRRKRVSPCLHAPLRLASSSAARATIASVSHRRPLPSYPQASIPSSSGPINCTPRVRSTSTFCLRRRVLPHLPVHGRRNQERSRRSQRNLRQRMAGQSMRQLGQDIRGRRRDEQQVGAIREFDVERLPASAVSERADDHRVS